MISKQEFLTLYSKWIDGQCSDEEIEQINAYRDEMKLLNGDWDDELGNKDEISDRIWQRLTESRTVVEPQKFYYRKMFWMPAAAAAILICAIGVFLKIKSNDDAEKLQASIAQKTILPGGDKAYLTMADGTRIALNDTKNGVLATQSGIKITKSKNGMLVYHIGSSAAKPGDTATKYNTIETPRGGQYQIVLDDGTKVWLNAMSSLRFPVSFHGNERRVVLSGEGYFEVAKNKAKPFLVAAHGSVVRVLGTHFDINAYADNNDVTTTLLEGSVELKHNNANVILTPGQQGKVKQNSERITVADADLEEVMGWKNGLFVFHNENILDVMKKVSRWYDIDVVYEGDVKDKEFGGSISKYKNITELLTNMELTQAIHYKIEGRRVTIMN